ncbi:MAG: hypothetical protein B6226_03410 [Candidatus Cloacimonetes bacterium 4572_65]|nr:MAG: hypothetical protein B6226_03410 [Candidatus Cloacimonetes bacterium 4572_65]
MAKEIKDHTFSLVEYLMIVMVIGILVVLVVPFSEANKVQPKIREMKDNINSILKAYDQVYAIDTLKINSVEAFNNNELKYTIEVNSFLKYVNFEKEYAKSYLSPQNRKDYINFLKTSVRPLVKIANLPNYDKFVANFELVRLPFDQDKLPNIGSFLQEDKFFSYYDLAENNLQNFIIKGTEEPFQENILGVISFVKELKSTNDQYVLSYNQLKQFASVNLIDINSVEDKYFTYQLNADSTIVATTTENFGTAGAQIYYSITDEIYTVGPKKLYDKLGSGFLTKSIESLPTKTATRDGFVNELLSALAPEAYDLDTSLISENQKTFLVDFENNIKENFDINEVRSYLNFYNDFSNTVSGALGLNKTRLELAIDKHDSARKPTAKMKSEITERVANWEKVIQLTAQLNAKVETLNKIVKAQDNVNRAIKHKELKENYTKSFNIIDYDWLILE